MPATAAKRAPVKRGRRGQPCTVCAHPRRDAIDRALVEGLSAPKVAAHYRGISDDAIRRHAEAHLPARLAKAAEVREVVAASDTLRQLQRCVERVNLLFDACDRWLRDPDEPSRYEIGPRAEDVRVTYAALGEDGKTTRKKAPLSELLARVDRIAPDVRLVETKHADPRELILHASRRLEGQAELMARLLGELKESPTVNVILSPEWATLRGVILAALGPFPEAHRALASALAPYAGR